MRTEQDTPQTITPCAGVIMDLKLLRKLAARFLRLASLSKDQEEAARLKMTAADYLEKADQLASEQPHQQTQQTGRDDKIGS